MTKTRFLLFLNRARTTVMPFASAELGRLAARGKALESANRGAASVVSACIHWVRFTSSPLFSELHHFHHRLLGVRFRWAATDPVRLERLHGYVAQALGDGITLSDLRWIANAGKELLSLGLPFAPEDAPLPESLKLISKDIKSVL